MILAFLAGLLSTLSPCVLPLLPLVAGAAASAHRQGPLALAAGLAMSFTIIGLVLATAGFALGLDGEIVRLAGAALLAGFGILLLAEPLAVRLGALLAPIADGGNRLLIRAAPQGWQGQFVIGLMLGLIWSPCVGPTLGAASVLAAQGEDLASVATTMALFGIGAALPLLLIGRLGGALLRRVGGMGKGALGLCLIAVALLVGSGLDKRLEAVLVEASPAWLTELTTRF